MNYCPGPSRHHLLNMSPLMAVHFRTTALSPPMCPHCSMYNNLVWAGAILACHTCAYKLMSLAIPSLSAQPVVINSQSIWNFRTSTVSKLMRPLCSKVPICVVDYTMWTKCYQQTPRTIFVIYELHIYHHNVNEWINRHACHRYMCMYFKHNKLLFLYSHLKIHHCDF
jgi:hypothetical protein